MFRNLSGSYGTDKEERDFKCVFPFKGEIFHT